MEAKNLPQPPSEARDKLLFTPGPLTTSRAVKQAMLRDLGSRDTEFIAFVRRIREELLTLAEVSKAGGYEAVLMQGSGTFGVESVISSVVPPDGKLLVLANGAYGERIAQMAAVHKIAATVLRGPENRKTEVSEVRAALAADPAITHVAAVHCETTTGILNPIGEIGAAAREASKVFIVDAMSSFGAVPVPMAAWGIDFLISSANKCIEGVPGFAFILARRAALLATEGCARSLSLDLLAQWKGLEQNGQFRYTPPIQSLLAFAQALEELKAEGGVPGRGARYRENHRLLIEGMRQMGFIPYIAPADQAPIITTFPYPDDPQFHFETLYERLSDRGFVIYPGKLTHADCFRIGNVGRLFSADIRALLCALRETLAEMGVRLPVSPALSASANEGALLS
jgi:2-aminoethylphosphonate-pyruvate transaminase